MKLLLIDDDREMLETLKEELERTYIVETSSTGDDAEYLATMNSYDLILLDLNLPKKNGKEICVAIRNKQIDVPIIVVSGEQEVITKEHLLNIGADDYVTKPFHIGELKARIRALLRRKNQLISTKTLTVSDLTLDLEQRMAWRAGKSISLRKKEFYLLEYLLSNAGKVLSRGMIFDHVWDTSSEAATNVVDVHIKYLRDQIDRPFSKKLIKTISGMGYKIEA